MLPTINVTFLGGAKRVTLAEQIKKLLSKANIEVSFYSIEKDEGFYPISCMAYIVSAPKFSDPLFCSILLEHLESTNSNVLACMDGAIPSLASLAQKNFGGGKVVVSSVDGARIALDKINTYDFCQEHNILHPRKFTAISTIDKDMHFIAKPIQGFGSRGIEKFCAREFAEKVKSLSETYIIQEFIEGLETTHDLYVFQDGRFISSSRDRIVAIDGEVEHCIVRRSSRQEEDLFAILAKTGLFWGPITVQTICRNKNVYLIEINARLGGGVTASIHAGFPVIEAWIEESIGIILPQRAFKSIEMKRARRDFYKEL